ncbi:cyclin N-terminal domain-containing protein 1-like [Arctopsyche grandis]|uniref:cyclin N-terminal domain-containing protein 1-like n=1 Tax=Arctopsyche grandis TaxID=121162 RepID=UPI00406D8F18
MSCLQLASKMINADEAIKTCEIKKLMMEEKQNYDTKTIVESEYKVFKTIDYQVPLHTRWDAIETLIEACAIPAGLSAIELYRPCFGILKLVYLLKDKLLSKWKWAIGSVRNLEDDEDCDLESLIPAAVVSAAYQLVFRDNHHIIKLLAENICRPHSDIKGLSDIMLIIVLE